MKEVLALIPARSGSKGVKDKNIKLLGGKPVINWSIEACLKSKKIDRVIVSTDSKEYAEIALKAGAEVPFLRPVEISKDNSGDKEFIVHALNFLKEHNELPELIAHIRPSTPIRNPDIIDKAIEVFMDSDNATALRSVHKMSESSYKNFEITSDDYLIPLGAKYTNDISNNPRQSFPPTYTANGYIDILSTKFITNFDLIHGEKVIPFMTPLTLEIDTEEDFMMLEHVIALGLK